MLSKKQFIAVYQEAAAAIKQIKLYNDKLNKKLGVSSTRTLLKQSQVQSEVVISICNKIEENIEKMEKSYLDPETARKIGTVKQQLRSQKDRRNLLLQNLQELSKDDKKIPQKPINKNNKHNVTFQMEQGQFNQQTTRQVRRKNSSTSSKQYKQNETAASNSQVMMEISDFDYEIQRKLMHEKSMRIGETHDQLIRVYGLMEQTSNLVDQQGDMVDIISDDLFTSYKNTVAANTELHEANIHHRRYRGKTCFLILFISLIMAAAAYVFFYLL